MDEAYKRYWMDGIQEVCDECGLSVTQGQLSAIADYVHICHENIGMAFYTPPSSDRISVLEEEKKNAVLMVKRELDQQREIADKCIKRLLKLRQDNIISLHEDGSVIVER